MLDALLREKLAAGAWWGLVVVALLALLVLLRTVRAGNRWIAWTTSLALGVSSGITLSYLAPPPGGPLLHFAWITSLCALGASILLAGERLRRIGVTPARALSPGTVPHVIGVVGLFAGSVSAAGVVLPLAQRVLEFLSELLTLRPWSGALPNYGASGAWTLAVLLLAASLAAWAARDSRPLPAILATALASATWLSLHRPVLHMESREAVRWTGGSVLLISALAGVLLAFGFLIRWWRERERAVRGGDDARGSASWSPAESRRTGDRIVLRLYRTMLTGTGAALLLLVWYHIVAPIDNLAMPLRVQYAVLAGAAAIAAAGAWAASERIAWSGTADTAFALLTTALACAGLACLPSFPATMAERYPPVFNALLVVFSLAAAGWTWLAESVPAGQRRADDVDSASLTGPARRFAFVCVLLALTSGGMMSFWPRLRSIATADFTLGRVTAGFGGHLVLLLVTLWIARRVRTPAFTLLVPLALLAAAGFLLMRMLPYTPRFG